MRQKISVFVLFSVLVAGASVAGADSLYSERQRSAAPMVQLPDFSKVADTLVPAVVSIQVEQQVKASQHRGGGGGGKGAPFEFFHRFFGEMPRQFQNRGLGTGFVIREDGLILTNNHVVENADKIEVTFMTASGDTRTMSAELLGAAPEYDVALLQAKKTDALPIAYLGDSNETKIGEWVVAVGNPFGLSHSVSVGIISAKERRDVNPSGRRGLYDFIQTDASINPGNSGGPLVNLKGEVIGINTAINAAGDGIGFAIPINMVKAMLPDLKNKGKFTKSWIGVRIQAVDEALAKSYGLGKDRGALVAEVVPGGPAAKFGVKEGDIILEFQGQPVRRSSDLPLYASMAGVGKEVRVKVWRDGKERTLKLKLGAFDDAPKVAQAGGEAQKTGSLGLMVADVTPELQRKFELNRDAGVVVESVAPGSVAAQAGLRPGDVLLSLNGRRMARARSFSGAYAKIKQGTVFRLQVSREGQGKLFVALKKP